MNACVLVGTRVAVLRGRWVVWSSPGRVGAAGAGRDDGGQVRGRGESQ